MLAGGILPSCSPTYPEKTLTTQLKKLVQQEENLIVESRISGKTLWVYFPIENMVSQDDMSWNTKGIEKASAVVSIVHRVLLSTDAKLNFVTIVATDIKNFGIELKTIEYVPDINEAVLEKFSRGEFFSRSVRDINFNPDAINDTTGSSRKFYDVTFDEFVSLQILHRTKSIFYKDKKLAKLFEIKSTGWTEKFGILKLEIELIQKRYDLTPEEEKIVPLDIIKMIAAEVVRIYNYKNFQAIEITNTFAKKTIKLTAEELKKVKINLPKLLD